MRKLYAVNLCVLVMIFMTAAAAGKPETGSKQIENLISSRIEILNDYYAGTEDFYGTLNRLEAIETGRLKRSDTAMMEACKNTDVERILKHDIDIKTCEKSAHDIIKGDAEITYVMEGCSGKSAQSGKYFYTAEKKGERVLLTQLKNIE